MLRLPGANGKLMHAEIRIGDSVVMLADEFPEWGSLELKSLKGSPVTIHLYVNETAVHELVNSNTGKKQLIIAGIVTEVCVAFPALSARDEGYEVFIVTDASGTFNKTTRDAAWARMEAASCQLMTWFGMACELHRDWRNDVEGLGALFSNHLPSYRCLITSYMAGQAAASK